MHNSIGQTVLKWLAGLLLSTGLIAPAYAPTIPTPAPDAQVSFGSFTPVQAQTFHLYGSGITSIATTIQLTSFKLPDASTTITMAMFGTIGYGTLEPGGTKEEQVSFTGVTQNVNGTAILTGVTRGLTFSAPVISSSALMKAHAGGVAFALSNTAGFYTQFVGKDNDTSITGVYTYATTSIPRLAAPKVYGMGDELLFVTYGQLASTSFAGTVDASTAQKGIVEIATLGESKVASTTGNTSAPLIPDNRLFSLTPRATSTVAITNASGTIDVGFISTSSLSSYLWASSSTYSGSSTYTGNVNFASLPNVPTTTVVTSTNVASVAYVQSQVPLVITTSTVFGTSTIDVPAANIATSTFTLVASQPLLINVNVSYASAGNANGCQLFVYLNNVSSTLISTFTNPAGTNGATYNMNGSWISGPVAAGSNTVNIKGNNSGGTTCTSVNKGILQVSTF